MAQPDPYVRVYNFENFQQTSPDEPLPANQLELELNTVKQVFDSVLNNLALIQRADGRLANASVGVAQLDAELQTGFSGVGSITVSAASPSGNPGAGTHLWFKTA